jgi:hypothetical protein
MDAACTARETAGRAISSELSHEGTNLGTASRRLMASRARVRRGRTRDVLLPEGQTPGASLPTPVERPIPQHLRQPEPLGLPSVQDPLHNVRRDAGQRQEPADVGVRDALLRREIGDRLRLT